MNASTKLLGTVAVLLTAASAWSAVTITKIGEYDINSLGCGGIVYLGGDSYYLLRDHDESNKAVIYPATITVDPSTGKIANNLKTDISASGIILTGNGDSEGIGLDPCSGGIWVSDEAGTIKEFRPNLAMASVPATRTAPIPAIYSKINSNKGLEALTVSGDGKTMWTANEEALKGDGSLSSYNVPTTVRLTKFARENVHDNWTAVGQWPYTCEPATSSLVSSYEFCGVAGLCALPDGSLLVLERETSTTTLGRFEIYRLTESSFTSATPILTWTDGLESKSYTPVSKGKALISNIGDDRDSVYSDFDIDVYEGICLGPRLANGDLSLLLVSDGGAKVSKDVIFFTVTAYTVPRICALRLSGLGEVVTVDIPAPEKGRASVEGRNYRFMKGTQVTSEITGLPVPVETAYTNRGAVAETGRASWAATGSSGGSGSTMTFTANGDVQATWTVVTDVETNTTSQLLANDSFEGYAAGTSVASLAGWMCADEEDCGGVVAETYDPPAVGYPLGREKHTKVLALEDADVMRVYDVDADSRATVDLMVGVVRTSKMPAVDEQTQTAIAVDSDGHVCLCHRDAGGQIVWTRLSDESFANDDWLRLSIVVDYASDEAHHAYLCPRINGALTDRGVAAPSSGAAQGGPWYRSVADVGQNGKGRIRSLALTGNCKVDDIVVGASGWKQEGIADEPSIPSEQGTMTVADGVATVTPAPNVRQITIANGESLAAVVLPPSVETIVGVPCQKIVIKAFGHDITGAFKITGDASGVTIALDPDGEVTIDGETITVRPQLASVEGVQESPFVVGDGCVSIDIRTIPGLVYRLRRAADVTVRTTGEPVGEPWTGDATRHVLPDTASLPTKAFYLITVSR